MSILIVKSKENLASAQLLIQSKYYNSSVHCCYYSSVQIMLHLLLNQFGYNNEEIKKEVEINGGRGSHVFAINKVFDKMKDKARFKALTFKREIGLLKNKRDNADYHEFEINEDFSKDALKQAVEINKTLTEEFKIVT